MCKDASRAGWVRKVGTNDLCGITVMGSDVFEAAYNGKDGTANISSCFMVDDGSLLPFFWFEMPRVAAEQCWSR